MEQHSVVRLAGDALREAIPQLAELLLDAVADGASVGFMANLDAAAAQTWWHAIAAAPAGRVVLAVRDTHGVAGAAILVPAAAASQPHRAEIGKLIVHRRARGRGIARQLLHAAEHQAREMGRWMLTLLTRQGCDAELLYRRLGWTLAGVLPDDSLTPDGRLCNGCIYVKRLR